MRKRKKSFSSNKFFFKLVNRAAIPAIVLIYLIFVSPIVDSFKSQDYIKNPSLNDFYIINVNKNISLFKTKEQVSNVYKYKVLKLNSLTPENVVLSYNDIRYEGSVNFFV